MHDHGAGAEFHPFWLIFFGLIFWFWFVGSTKEGRTILYIYLAILIVWLIYH